MKRKLLLLFWLSRTNVKLVMVSLTGLIIALSMLAGCLYYLDFSQQEMYLNFFEEEGIEQMVFTFSLSRNARSRKYEVVNAKSFLDEKIDQYGLGQCLTTDPLYPVISLNEVTSFQNQSDRLMISGHFGIDETILEESFAGSRLPVNQTEILVLAPDNTTLTINDKVDLSILNSWDHLENDELIRYEDNYNFSLIVAGIITNSMVKEDSILRDFLPDQGYHFFSSFDNFNLLVQDIEQGLEIDSENFDSKHLFFTTLFKITFDLNNIDQSVVVETIDNLVFVLETGGSDLRISGSSNMVMFKLSSTLLVINTYFLQFLILSVPVLVLVVVLILFSLGLVNEKRHESLALMKNRGISRQFIFLVLFVEIIIVALVATLISAIAGIPLALFIGTSSEFLTFHRDISGLTLVIKPSILQTLLLQGIGFTVLVHLPSMVKLSRSEIIVHEEEASKKKKRKTGILRSRIDILLLFLGLVGMLIFNMFMELLKGSGSLVELLSLLSLFILPFLVITPLLFLIGSIMSYNRFIPLITHYLGHFFWKRNWRLLATTTRNLNVNIKVVTRITLLIAITLSFVVILVSLPVSVQQYNEDGLYYDNGSEISIHLFEETEEKVQDLMTVLRSINGLKTTKVIITWKGDPFHNYFMGIEPDLHEVAHWQGYYDDEPLEMLVSALFASDQNNTVVVDSKVASGEQILLNDTYDVVWTNPGGSHSLEVIPMAFTNYFPGFPRRNQQRNRYYVCKYSFADNITDNPTLGAKRYIWGKVLPGYDPVVVTRQVRDTLDDLISKNQVHSFSKVSSVVEDLEENRLSNFFWLAFNYNFLGALTVILVAVVLFAFARITHNVRGIALGRALGMKYHQLLLLIFAEPLVLFILSGIPGSIIGALLLEGSIVVYGQAFIHGAPLVMVYNVPLLLSVYGLILIVIVITGMITSIVTTRVNVAEALKVET
jgi:ABC-type antimicrobial peptide transport system permease subunit